MKIIRKETAPQYQRDNIRSFLLIAESTVGAKSLTTSLVEMAPGGTQKPHHHETEQCYTILQGRGTMAVDGEEAPVTAGDTIFIPANHTHSLHNPGPETLTYLSAGSPVFGAENEKKLWPLNLT